MCSTHVLRHKWASLKHAHVSNHGLTLSHDACIMYMVFGGWVAHIAHHSWVDFKPSQIQVFYSEPIGNNHENYVWSTLALFSCSFKHQECEDDLHLWLASNFMFWYTNSDFNWEGRKRIVMEDTKLISKFKTNSWKCENKQNYMIQRNLYLKGVMGIVCPIMSQ